MNCPIIRYHIKILLVLIVNQDIIGSHEPTNYIDRDWSLIAIVIILLETTNVQFDATECQVCSDYMKAHFINTDITHTFTFQN